MPPPVKPKRTIASVLGAHLRAKLFAGVLALIPLVTTFLVLRLVFNWLDGLVQPLVREIFGREIVGVGIAIFIVTVYVAGVLATNIFGRMGIRWAENVITRIPIVRFVYNIAKEISDSIQAARGGPSRVVMVEWPKAGTYTIAFLTHTSKGDSGKLYHTVLIPTTPTPQSGLLAILPEEEVTFTDLTVEEGIKMVVSSGFLSPENLMKGIKEAAKARAAVAPAAVDTVDKAVAPTEAEQAGSSG